MARQNSTKQTESTETGKTTAPTEGAESTETKTETPIDISSFVTAASAAVEQRDTSTGVLSADVIESVNKVYRDLDGVKSKNAAKKHVEDEMLKAVEDLNIQLARAYGDLKGNLTAAGGSSKSEAKPADPTQAFVQRVASLQLAYNEVVSNVPEKVGEDWSEQVTKLIESLGDDLTKYRTWLTTETPEGEEKPSAPEVSPVVRNAFKLATGKASGGGRQSGGSGVRRDIGKHIASAFAEVESGGFLTVAQIANHKSAEYGDDHPSQGAVSARLFPQSGKCTVEGITPRDKQGDNPRGAVKA